MYHWGKAGRWPFTQEGPYWASVVRAVQTSIAVFAALSLFGEPIFAARANPAREIVINIPAYRLFLYENGEVIRSYPVGVGQSLKPSVLGPTEIINKVHDPTYYPPDWWRRGLQPIPPGPDNPVGTRWLGLGFPGYGIHGTNNPDSIGKAVSSGCIRLRNEDVEELARLVGIGTPVRLEYNTVEIWHDSERGLSYVQVHPDIYGLGTTTMENARAELEALGVWDEIDIEHLRSTLVAATGSPQPLKRRTPFAAEMIEDHAVSVFPKRAVGLFDGHMAEVRVAALIEVDGSVAGLRLARTSGMLDLDAYALRLAESAVTFRPYDRMYEIQFAIVFDASDPGERRTALRPEGTIQTPTLADFDSESTSILASRPD